METTPKKSKTVICKQCGEEKDYRIHYYGGFEVCSACRDKKKEARRQEEVEKRRLLRIRQEESKKQTKQRHRDKKEQAKQKSESAKKRKEREVARVKADLERAKEIKRSIRKKQARVNLVKRELGARELARRHLLPFILRMKSDYQAGWVHKDICRRLEQFSKDVEDKKSPRLILMMPPRSGKSELSSIQFPAWHLGRNPDHEVISTSHGSALANDFSRKVRGAFREEPYQKIFSEARLDKDSQNTEGWKLTKGGGYTPAGVGGPIVGKGAHILIVDDPVKNAEEAESETTRESIWNWYTSTAYTRLAPGGGVIVIMQRWHDDDLSGRLEKKMNDGEGDVWDIVRYPAVADEDEKYRRKGEALHPERYDIKAMERIKRAVGPRVWAALYQQQPVADEGGYFSRENFQWYKTGQQPHKLHYYAAWDLAIGKGDRNDFTVGVVVGVDADDNLWVTNMYRGRWDSFQIVEQMINAHKHYNLETTGIEKGQIQMAIGPYLKKRMREEKLFDMHVKDLPTGRRDKEARARAIQGRIKQGMVFFPKEALWMEDMVNEMLRFPHGAHDDIVDALAWIGLMMQELTPPSDRGPRKSGNKPASWKERLSIFNNSKRRSAMTA